MLIDVTSHTLNKKQIYSMDNGLTRRSSLDPPGQLDYNRVHDFAVVGMIPPNKSTKTCFTKY
jgi:hypothetical protein